MKGYRPIIAMLLAISPMMADVKLPGIFSDHMVLLKAEKVPVWGKAASGEEVSVTLNGRTVRTRADAAGNWRAELNLKDSPPGPFEMTVQGKNRVTISDVLVGEVWLASGQSNMALSLDNTLDGKQEVARSANPMLRQFSVSGGPTPNPVDANEGQGKWLVAGPETSGSFSGVGYYFGKALQSELKAPVAIIHASVGSTEIEAWTSSQALDLVPELKAKKDHLFSVIRDYPKTKANYGKELGAWIAAHGRQDKPVANPETYTAENVSSDGWITVKVPGMLTEAGIPPNGAFWMRREVDVRASDLAEKRHFGVELRGFNTASFHQFYWNGKLVRDIDFATYSQDYPSLDAGHSCGVPPEMIKEGRNVLAVRFYTPMGTTLRLDSTPIINVPGVRDIPIDGDWQAKVEYEFPTMDRAAVPAPPEKPPGLPPTYLFNGMIHPLETYAIRGFIWYQGESNTERAWQYRLAFPALIQDWRKRWKRGDVPFYFCQIANGGDKTDGPPKENASAELRESQTLALKLPNTGQAILIDVGEAHNIHGRNKKDPGERLAQIALARDYGRKIAASGPMFESMKVEDGKVRITFTGTDGGLVAKPLPAVVALNTETGQTGPLRRYNPNSELEGFAICGEDQNWQWADATIDGNSVVVWSDKVPNPTAVRYAYAANPTCNLYNGAGLPAAPFRTDDFPAGTRNAK